MEKSMRIGWLKAALGEEKTPAGESEFDALAVKGYVLAAQVKNKKHLSVTQLRDALDRRLAPERSTSSCARRPALSRSIRPATMDDSSQTPTPTKSELVASQRPSRPATVTKTSRACAKNEGAPPGVPRSLFNLFNAFRRFYFCTPFCVAKQKGVQLFFSPDYDKFQAKGGRRYDDSPVCFLGSIPESRCVPDH